MNAANISDSRSTLATLSKVVQSGINVLVWAGDADWMCNWVGGYAVANNVTFSGQDDFRSKTLEPYTVNGTQKGTFKNVDNLSFLRVFEAGHETSFYRECPVYSCRFSSNHDRTRDCSAGIYSNYAEEVHLLHLEYGWCGYNTNLCNKESEIVLPSISVFVVRGVKSPSHPGSVMIPVFLRRVVD